MKCYKIKRKDLVKFLNSKCKERFKCKESDIINIKLDGNDYNEKCISVFIQENV